MSQTGSLSFGFWCSLERKKGRQDPHARNRKTAPRLHWKPSKSRLPWLSMVPKEPTYNEWASLNFHHTITQGWMIVLVDYLKEKPFEQSVIWFNENFVYKSLLLSPKLDRTSLLVKVCLQLFVFNWPFSTTFSCHQKKCTFYFLPINRKKAGTVNTLLLVNAPERKGQNARSIEICTLGIWTMYLSSNTMGCF